MDAGRTAAYTPQSRYARFDRFEFDLSTRSLSRDGIPLVLEREGAALLTLLVSRAGRPVTRNEIQRRMSGGWHPASDYRVDAWLGQVRTALGDFSAPSRYLETLPDGSVRFIAPVRFRSPPSAITRGLSRWAGPASAILLLVLTVTAVAVPAPDRPTPPRHALHADEGEARSAYLNGRYLLEHGSGDRLRKSQRSFEAALAADSQYAPAYVGLARVYLQQRRTDRAGLRLANEAIARALQLDDTLAEAYHLLGNLRLSFYHDFRGADLAYQRALSLSPEDAPTLRSYAMLLSYMGRHAEALERIRDAALSDPISAEIRGDAGMIHYYAGDYAGAVAECHGAVELDPAHGPARLCLLLAYDRLGLYDQALVQARALAGRLELTPAGRLETGREDGAAALEAWWRGYACWLAEAAADGHADGVPVAMAYARSGQVDSALAWLERGATDRTPGLLSARVDPMFDSLRRLRRFRDAMARLQTPAAGASLPDPAPARNPFMHPALRQTVSLRH